MFFVKSVSKDLLKCYEVRKAEEWAKIYKTHKREKACFYREVKKN